MIAAWMLSTLVAGAFISLAVNAADRVFLAVRRPTRFVWLAAMLVTVLWPGIAIVRSRLFAPSAMTTPPSTDTRAARLTAVVVRASDGALPVPIDPLLLTCWAVATAVLLARMVHARRVLGMHGREWRTHWVDGVRVRLSRDVGPAVVGLDPTEVVLPEWTLELDEPLRALVLAHEGEHRRALDPHLLLAGALLAVMVPWNIALWWQLRRLRLAIELDCDARVLRGDPRPDRYGLLLLAIAQRRAAGAPLPTPALSEPTSFLERRIDAMLNPLRPSRVALFALGGVAVVSIAVACRIDAPKSPAAATASAPDTTIQEERAAKVVQKDKDIVLGLDKTAGRPAPAANAATPSAATSSKALKPIVEPKVNAPPGSPAYYDFQVEKTAQLIPGSGGPQYPDALKAAGVKGEVQVQFVVGADGRADVASLKVLRATNTDFEEAVRAWLPNARFEAAEVKGAKVRQLVQLPFVFAIK